jgi:hypothetical protein
VLELAALIPVGIGFEVRGSIVKLFDWKSNSPGNLTDRTKQVRVMTLVRGSKFEVRGSIVKLFD